MPIARSATVMTRVQRRTLLACILGSGIAFLDGTLVNVALPAIRRDLGGGLAGQQWVVDGYLLSLGALVLVGGSLGDLLGRRRIFGLGVASFGLASASCAVAPTVGALVAVRLVQGVAGALLVPNSLAMLFDTFNDQERARAIGSWTSWTGIATVAGPLLGGAIVDGASWRWVFVLNVPVAGATLWLLRGVPSSRATADIRLDWPGASLCAAGLGLATFALIDEPGRGWSSLAVWLPLAAGILAFGGFLLREHLAASPMMPLELFRARNFRAGNLATFAIYGAVPAATFFLVLFLQQVRGASALTAGALLLPSTVMIFLFAKRFGALADRIGARPFMTVGPLVAAAGLVVLLALTAHGPYVAVVLIGTAVLGLGLSISVAALTATVLGAVEESHDGLASGVNNAVARVGGLLAIALIGAVVAAHFAGTVNRSLHTADPGVRAAAGMPLSVSASRFPVAERPHVRGVLEHASVDSLRVALLISVGLAVIAGMVSLGWVRDERRSTRAADVPAVAICGASRGLHEPTRPRLPDAVA